VEDGAIFDGISSFDMMTVKSPTLRKVLSLIVNYVAYNASHCMDDTSTAKSAAMDKNTKPTKSQPRQSSWGRITHQISLLAPPT